MATIGGSVLDPAIAGCNFGHIEQSFEKIEGSPGPDVLAGDSGPNVLLGRGGMTPSTGAAAPIAASAAGANRATSCESTASVP